MTTQERVDNLIAQAVELITNDGLDNAEVRDGARLDIIERVLAKRESDMHAATFEAVSTTLEEQFQAFQAETYEQAFSEYEQAFSELLASLIDDAGEAQ